MNTEDKTSETMKRVNNVIIRRARNANLIKIDSYSRRLFEMV